MKLDQPTPSSREKTPPWLLKEKSLPLETEPLTSSRIEFHLKSTSSEESLLKPLKSRPPALPTTSQIRILKENQEGQEEKVMRKEDQEEKVRKEDLEEKAKREDPEDKGNREDPEEKRVKKEDPEDKVKKEDQEEKETLIEDQEEKVRREDPEKKATEDPERKATEDPEETKTEVTEDHQSSSPRSVPLNPETKDSTSSLKYFFQ